MPEPYFHSSSFYQVLVVKHPQDNRFNYTNKEVFLHIIMSKNSAEIVIPGMIVKCRNPG